MVITGAVALLAAVLLGVVRRQPWPLDIRWQHDLAGRLDGQDGLLRLLVLPSEPVVLLPAIAVIAGGCLLQRRRDDAVLAVVAPAVAIVLNTAVLKPLFHWSSDGSLEYPSGHTASLAAVCAILVVLARPGVARGVAVSLGVLLTAAAGLGMVALRYHYPADIVGGMLVGAGVVLVSRRLWPARSVD